MRESKDCDAFVAADGQAAGAIVHRGSVGSFTAGAGKLRISVVTPSYKQVDYLKCCAASVRDQEGDFEVEHLIHDGGSGSEFDEWALSQRGGVCVAERDEGMYDAINRGFQKASGDVIAWLNCDEQYLPGTLESVARFFQAHPETDILFGDVILVDEVMTPLAYRRAVMPTLGHIRYSHLSTYSAATFVRRRVLDAGHFLQTRWKAIADAVWIEELLRAGFRAATLHEPLAIFCMLGSNLGQSSTGLRELQEWQLESGATSKVRRFWYVCEYRLARLLAGGYRPRMVRCSVYVPGNSGRLVQERLVTSRWDRARVAAAHSRWEREGTLGGLVLRVRRTRWALAHAICIIATAVYVDSLVLGDAVKGPTILLASLVYLAFRSKVLDLIPIAALYFLISWYLLTEKPFDVQVVRLATFTFGAVVAIFWAATLRKLEEWIRSTVALVRRMNEPIMLTDRRGRVIMVNKAACTLLQGKEQAFLLRELVPLSLGEDGSVTKRLMIFDLEDRLPDGVLGLAVDAAGRSLPAKARVFVVGRGKRRVYGFTLVETPCDPQSRPLAVPSTPALQANATVNMD